MFLEEFEFELRGETLVKKIKISSKGILNDLCRTFSRFEVEEGHSVSRELFAKTLRRVTDKSVFIERSNGTGYWGQ